MLPLPPHCTLVSPEITHREHIKGYLFSADIDALISVSPSAPDEIIKRFDGQRISGSCHWIAGPDELDLDTFLYDPTLNPHLA